MTTFQARSKRFLRDVSVASAWMMKRNIGRGHWWRWSVLTTNNPDQLKRPIFDDRTAMDIFSELERRDLLEPFALAPNCDSGAQAYLMRYDVQGWDRAVSDGRPIIGVLLKARREWLLMLFFFLLGCIFATIEGYTVGSIDAAVEWYMKLIR